MASWKTILTAAMDAALQSAFVAQVHSPGKELSQDMAVLLRRENFVAVLGSDAIDSWKVDWVLLENSDVSFSDPRNAAWTSQLLSRLKRCSGMANASCEFELLLMNLFKLRMRISVIDKERLKVCARQYFTQRFPNAVAVDFRPKYSGSQSGFKILVQLPDREELKYHLKIHSGGKLESNSSCVKPVDPRELLIYKILERLEEGTETHFVHRSIEDVFIATLDAGHAEGSMFSTFQLVMGIHSTCDETINRETIWGSLLADVVVTFHCLFCATCNTRNASAVIPTRPL